MKKWLALPVLALALLLAYVVAGPFLAYNGIRDAVQAQDTGALARHVDFPVLRANLKAQVDDYVVRRAGPDAQASLYGAVAVRIASGLAGGAVDTMVTPAGIGALLQGRAVWHRASGGGVTGNTYEHASPGDPLREPDYGFDSPSRVSTNVTGSPLRSSTVAVKRDGLQWKLTDIRLPISAVD